MLRFCLFLAQNEPPVLDAQYRHGVDSATNSFGSVVAWIPNWSELENSTQIHVNPITTTSTLLKATHQSSVFRCFPFPYCAYTFLNSRWFRCLKLIWMRFLGLAAAENLGCYYYGFAFTTPRLEMITTTIGLPTRPTTSQFTCCCFMAEDVKMRTIQDLRNPLTNISGNPFQKFSASERLGAAERDLVWLDKTVDNSDMFTVFRLTLNQAIQAYFHVQ